MTIFSHFLEYCEMALKIICDDKKNNAVIIIIDSILVLFFYLPDGQNWFFPFISLMKMLPKIPSGYHIEAIKTQKVQRIHIVWLCIWWCSFLFPLFTDISFESYPLLDIISYCSDLFITIYLLNVQKKLVLHGKSDWNLKYFL